MYPLLPVPLLVLAYAEQFGRVIPLALGGVPLHVGAGLYAQEGLGADFFRRRPEKEGDRRQRFQIAVKKPEPIVYLYAGGGQLKASIMRRGDGSLHQLRPRAGTEKRTIWLSWPSTIRFLHKRVIWQAVMGRKKRFRAEI